MSFSLLVVFFSFIFLSNHPQCHRKHSWGSYYTEKVGCPASLGAAARMECLRNKSVDEILEPYTQWLCPVKRPDDPWCNRSKLSNFSTPQGGSSWPGEWPNPRPPMAPIVGWAATVDGTAEGSPDTPYHDMLKGKVNRYGRAKHWLYLW